MALVYSLALLPALIAVAPPRPDPTRSRSMKPDVSNRLLVAAGVLAGRHPWKVTILTVLIVATSVAAASRIRFSQDILLWFPPSNDLRLSTEFLDANLAGVSNLVLEIDTKREDGLHDPEVLRRMDGLNRRMEQYTRDGTIVGKTLSLVDIVKEIHQALNENVPDFYALPDDRRLVAQELLLFENSGNDDLQEFVDAEFRKASFTVTRPWVDPIENSVFVESLQLESQRIMGEEAEVRVTGMGALTARTMTAVVQSMTRSYLIAFLLITPLMVLMIGSLRAGLVSMVPNLMPIVVTLGVMGALDMPIDTPTLMVGAIALGLAVDDTIHFIHTFQRHFRKSSDAALAIRRTLETTGRALLFTSIVLSLGFSVFMLGELTCVFAFGLLAATAIGVAFVADILITPALLVLVSSSSIPGKAHRIPLVSVAVAAAVALPTTVLAETLTAREIMQRVEDRDDGDDGEQDMEMILIDKDGNHRVRRIHAFSKDRGADDLQLMFFVSPADVKDTGFLTFDYDGADRDDDQWLYLPALRKTKRIASSDKSGSFMGSDFNYSDMTDRELDNYDYTLMGETDVRGVRVWQIEAIPRTKEEIDRTGYKKSIVFVRQDNYVVIRAVSWTDRGGKLKYFDVKKLERIDGIWVPTEMHMTTKSGTRTLHKTILKNQNVRFNQELDERMFSLRQLEKGL
jgi:hypothetical protein